MRQEESAFNGIALVVDICKQESAQECLERKAMMPSLTLQFDKSGFVQIADDEVLHNFPHTGSDLYLHPRTKQHNAAFAIFLINYFSRYPGERGAKAKLHARTCGPLRAKIKQPLGIEAIPNPQQQKNADVRQRKEIRAVRDCASYPRPTWECATMMKAAKEIDEADDAASISDTRAAWDRIAPGYDRTNTPTQMWLGNEVLRRAGLHRGMRFLDVAAGSGALSIPAARLGAHVLATDQSPAMLELLGKRARSEKLAIDTRVMDGQALDLEDASFDVAGSQFGVMLFPDMPKGISEMARVVRPGGRVLMSVYGDPHEIEFFGFFLRAVQTVRPDFSGPPMQPPPLPFQLQDPERLRRELERAGLTDIKVETITETTEFRTGQELWTWLVWSNPIVETMLSGLNLTNDERSTIQQALERMVRERAGGGAAAALTDPINLGIGTK